MEIKDILKSGGSVSINYKENSKDWVGSSKIYSIPGAFGIKPRIIVEVPTLEINGRKEFSPDEIDEAISLFKRLTFRRKNLWFKMHEAITHFTSKGESVDLEIKGHFIMVDEKRLELIEEYENK
jgi:hypothetical protein